MIAVSNASPLISLAKLNCLSLLSDVFGEIRISSQVFNEVVVAGAGRPAASAVQGAGWIRVEPCRDLARVKALQSQYNLGAGEAATLVLAQEISADLTIIDERTARGVASTLGIKVIGCIGILEVGHRRGLVADLRETYRQMLDLGIRIDSRILDRSLTSLNLQRI